jgi:hypothetical protein
MKDDPNQISFDVWAKDILPNALSGAGKDILAMPYVFTGVKPPMGTGAALEAPADYWLEEVESPYHAKGSEPRITKVERDLASTFMLWQSMKELSSVLNAWDNWSKFNEFKTRLNKFFDKDALLTNAQRNTIGKLEDVLWEKFTQPTYNVYGGLPARFGNEPVKSAIEMALSKVNQPIWATSQLLGFLKGKVPQVEIENLLNPIIKNVDKISTEDVIKGVQSNIPQLETVVKGARENAMTYGDWQRATGLSGDNAYAEYLERFNKETGNTKFSQYQLPGGENYREVLIKAPDPFAQAEQRASELQRQLRELENIRIKEENAGIFDPNKQAKSQELFEAIQRNRVERTELGKLPTFKSTHWDEPNVIAHMRLNDRTTPDGKKVLFIEEIQSDWAKAVREKGAKISDEEYVQLNTKIKDAVKKLDKLVKEGKGGSEEYLKIQQEADELLAKRKLKDGEVSHPLLKNWQELALKKVLKEAVEGGYDSIAWTTGEQQIKRYPGAEAEKDVEKMRLGTTWAHNLYDRQIPNILKDLTGGEVKESKLIVDVDPETYKGLVPDEVANEGTLTQQSLTLTPEVKARLGYGKNK